MAAPACEIRLRVAAVIVRDGLIVLARHHKGDQTYHLLPGGGVEPGETLAQALVREVREESGLEIDPIRPVLLSDSIAPDGSRHMVQIAFLAEVTGGEIVTRPSDRRVQAIDVLPIGDLGTLDLRPPTALAIQQAAHDGFEGPARYLGALWSPEQGSDHGGDS